MDIPFKIQILQQLGEIYGFKIVRFQDNGLTNPDLHWYVLIRAPKESRFLVIIITSQIGKRIAYYRGTKKPKAADCLVEINNDTFSFLKKPSIVECNKTEDLSAEEIIHKIDEAKGFMVREEKVPAYLRQEIVSAIINSPMISPFIRNKARAANPL